jgi:hypothetical protein
LARWGPRVSVPCIENEIGVFDPRYAMMRVNVSPKYSPLDTALKLGNG